MEKNILLDIGNVILDVNFNLFCQKVAANVGDEKKIFDKFCTGPLKEKLDRGREAPLSFLNLVIDYSKRTDLTISSIIDYWQNIFSLRPSSEEVIRKLKSRFNIWIMSDTDPIHFSYFINNYPLLRSFDKYFLSYTSGYLKKDDESFLNISKKLSIPLDRLILIDDNQDNCKTASSVGVSTLLFEDWYQIYSLLTQ